MNVIRLIALVFGTTALTLACSSAPDAQPAPIERESEGEQTTVSALATFRIENGHVIQFLAVPGGDIEVQEHGPASDAPRVLAKDIEGRTALDVYRMLTADPAPPALTAALEKRSPAKAVETAGELAPLGTHPARTCGRHGGPPCIDNGQCDPSAPVLYNNICYQNCGYPGGPCCTGQERPAVLPFIGCLNSRVYTFPSTCSTGVCSWPLDTLSFTKLSRFIFPPAP